jgi:hypothetical protein
LPAGLLTPQEGVIPHYLAFLGRIAPEKGPGACDADRTGVW